MHTQNANKTNKLPEQFLEYVNRKNQQQQQEKSNLKK